jgi:hypothetical protein
MEGKLGLFAKWSFVFSVLILWTVFVFNGLIDFSDEREIIISQEYIAANDVDSVNLEARLPNLPLYIESGSNVQKARSFDVINYLFRKNFDIEERSEIVSDSICSIRARNGIAKLNNIMYQDKNKVNFYLSLPQSARSQGSFSFSNGEERVSFQFIIEDIVSDGDVSIYKISGDGRHNREKFLSDGILEIDKENNIINIALNENIDFYLSGMEINFKEGCGEHEENFYLMIEEEELEGLRSIEEVRDLLNEYPMLEQNFNGLGRLNKPYWILVLPDGFVS